MGPPLPRQQRECLASPRFVPPTGEADRYTTSLHRSSNRFRTRDPNRAPGGILATCLKENSPELVKSRPYIRWVLAEEELARKVTSESDLKQHLSKFPGLTVWRSPVPIYVPLKSENPGWPVSKTPTLSTGFLETGLQAARELGGLRDRRRLFRRADLSLSRTERFILPIVVLATICPGE
ncbi:hypothetical protein VTN96DRAFT_2406 [Rasamsonia emersonii]